MVVENDITVGMKPDSFIARRLSPASQDRAVVLAKILERQKRERMEKIDAMYEKAKREDQESGREREVPLEVARNYMACAPCAARFENPHGISQKAIIDDSKI